MTGQLWPNSGGAPQGVGQLWPRASGGGEEPPAGVEFIGAGNGGQFDAGAGSPAISPHVNTVEGDTLIWAYMQRGLGAADTCTLPAGWDVLALIGPSAHAGDGAYGCGERQRQAGDTSYQTVAASTDSAERHYQQMLTYRGEGLTFDLSAATHHTSGGATLTVDASGLVAIEPGGKVLVMAGLTDDCAEPNLLTGDGLDWVQRFFASTSLGNDGTFMVVEGTNNTDDPIVVTNKTFSWAAPPSIHGWAWMVAINPA